MTEKLTRCPVCDGDKAKRSLIMGSLYYYKCARCGVQFLNPRMDDAETDEYYRGQYRINCPVNTNDIINQRERATTQTLELREFLNGGTALEIGCSAGYLLNALMACGYEVSGVDPDNKRIQTSNNLTVYANLSSVPKHMYDLICMSHVLEHFNWPASILRLLIETYAHIGTRIMIEVPNAPQNSGAYKIHHPIAFDMSSLHWLMDFVGCKPLVEMTHGLGSIRQFFILGLFEVL